MRIFNQTRSRIRCSIGCALTALLLMSKPVCAQVNFPVPKLSKKGESTAETLAQCFVYYRLHVPLNKRPGNPSLEFEKSGDAIFAQLEGLTSVAKTDRATKRVNRAFNEILLGSPDAKASNAKDEQAFERFSNDKVAMGALTKRLSTRCEALIGQQAHLDRSMFEFPEEWQRAIEKHAAGQDAQIKKEERYASASARLTRLLGENDLRGFTSALHGEPISIQQRLLRDAPCLAVALSSATVDSARAVYRMAQQDAARGNLEPDERACYIADHAIHAGRADMLKMAIEEGASVTEKHLEQLASSYYPAGAALPPPTKLKLFDVLADAPGADQYDWSSLLRLYAGDPALPWALLEKRGGLKGIDDHGAAALREMMLQARGNNRPLFLQQIERLIAAGVDVNKPTRSDDPPILKAGCDAEVISLLLAGGAAPNVTDVFKHETPLHRALACETGPEKVALTSLLIKAGADVNFTRSDRPNARRSVLAEVCEAGAEPDLQALLKRAGAKVDIADQYGRTALMDLYRKTPQSVANLIACGASVNARDKNGRTALEHLVDAGAFAAAAALCDHGGEPAQLCSGEALASRQSSPEGICFRAEFSPGMPVPNRHYVAELTDGSIVEGRTDADGRTLLCGDDVINGAKFSVIHESPSAGRYPR